MKITYVGDLVKCKEYELLKAPNFGRKSLVEIKQKLSYLGLFLGMEIKGWPPNVNGLLKVSHFRS